MADPADGENEVISEQLDEIARSLGFRAFDIDVISKTMLAVMPHCALCIVAGRKSPATHVDAMALVPDLKRQSVPVALLTTCSAHHEILVGAVDVANETLDAAHDEAARHLGLDG